MAFVMKKGASYSWPVRFQVPANGGAYEEQKFNAIFKRLPQSAVNEALNAPEATDKKFAQLVMIGWEGIENESGAALEFTLDLFEELLDIPSVAAAISTAYIESISGARIKN